MKNLAVLVVLIFLTGCANMTQGQKTAAWVVAGVVVTGIALSSSGGSSNSMQEKDCAITLPNNSPGNFVCP